MTFRGWPVEALEFFEGLAADNSKAYWQRNKAVYDEVVRAPMEELLAELAPEFGEGRIFRPYRDIRFSRDKSPYKTQIGAMVGDGYVQLTAEGLAVGSGMWEMAPDQLERYRAAVSEGRSGGKLARLVVEARADRPRRDGSRGSEDGPEGVSEGPSSDRAPALQGPRRVARMAGRCVAGHAAGQGTSRRVPP